MKCLLLLRLVRDTAQLSILEDDFGHLQYAGDKVFFFFVLFLFPLQGIHATFDMVSF